ncbi:hypothetical protein PENTCL1PPCAC_14385, partial [Pristionchus entomophagus]
PLFLSEHSLIHPLFIAYTLLLGITLIACLLLLIVLAFNRDVFHLSFQIILAQILCCGFGKIMTRTISYFGIGDDTLYSVELTFD